MLVSAGSHFSRNSRSREGLLKTRAQGTVCKPGCWAPLAVGRSRRGGGGGWEARGGLEAPSSHVPGGLKLSFLSQFRQNNSSCLQARRRCGELRVLMGRQAGWEGRERGREGDPMWREGEGFELADLSS